MPPPPLSPVLTYNPLVPPGPGSVCGLSSGDPRESIRPGLLIPVMTMTQTQVQMMGTTDHSYYYYETMYVEQLLPNYYLMINYCSVSTDSVLSRD